MINSYIDKLLPDMGPVVWVWVVCVHILDSIEYPNGIECVVVLVDMIPHHHIEEIPSYILVRGYALVSI